MKSKSKIIAALLCIAMVLMLVPGAVFAAPAPVCEINGTQYATLDEALAAVTDGQTITMLATIDYNQGISITDGRNIIFNLNGFNLNIASSGGVGLTVTSGSVGYTGAGAFNVSGASFGLNVNGSNASATVTNATATFPGSYGANASNGGSITINNDVYGGYAGAFAFGANSNIVVSGDATGNDANSYGAYANGGTITIGGNAQGVLCGVSANGGSASATVTNATATSEGGNGAVAINGGDIIVNGNAQGGYNGVSVANIGSTAVVNGNATGTAAFDSSGARAGFGGSVTINGGTAQGVMYGAYANGSGSHITINGGDAIGTGPYSHGVHAEADGIIHVTGNTQGTQYGVYSGNGTSVVVTGNATVTAEVNGWGVNAQSGGAIVIGGNVVANGSSLGAFATSGGEITVDGAILASKYIQIFDDIAEKPVYKDGSAGSRTIPTTKDGYFTYSAGTSTVWVKEAAPATYTIDPIGNQTMTALTAGYASGTQETRTVTVTRTGTGDLTNLAAALSGANASDFIITQPAVTTLNAGTPSTTFTVKAKDGLAAGTYAATVTVTADNMTNVTFTVTQVVGATPTVSATLSSATANFDKNPANQADVSNTITWNDAASVTDVKKAGISVGAAAYAVSGNTLTIKKEYLATQPTGSLVLTVEFDRGNEAMLTITVQDTTPPTGSNPPAWPAGSTLTASGTTKTRTTLSWTAAEDDAGVTGYRIFQDNSLIQTVTSAVYSCEVTGLSPSTTYTFKVQAGDADNNWTDGPTVTVRTDSSGGGGGGSSTPTPVPEPEPAAWVLDSNENISKTIAIKLDNSTGAATVEVDAASLISAFDKSATDDKGVKTVVVDIPNIDGAKAYEPILPASFLTAGDASKAVEINTGVAAVTVPSNMLTAADAAGAQNVSLTIAAGDKNKLDAAVQAQIGDRPVIELNLKIDGKQTAWSNEGAHVTITVPYTPTADELKDPEHITVWFIDGSGKAVAVPNGSYDSTTGKVTFNTTHFSKYAIVFVQKTFSDIAGYGWAKNQIEVLASKGIINGTSNDTFSPAANITRADYLVLLVKTLGLTAEFDSNFNDVEPGTYYYEAAGIAKKLGLAAGSGNNRFNPKENISRQDMMVLTARVLEKYKGLKVAGDFAVLDKFSDKRDIAGYAVDSLATLVKEGLISGSGDKLNPRAQTTRAESAVFLYRIYK